VSSGAGLRSRAFLRRTPYVQNFNLSKAANDGGKQTLGPTLQDSDLARLPELVGLILSLLLVLGSFAVAHFFGEPAQPMHRGAFLLCLNHQPGSATPGHN
jgi:hypothetical protein